jgi:hypothetical protein
MGNRIQADWEGIDRRPGNADHAVFDQPTRLSGQ